MSEYNPEQCMVSHVTSPDGQFTGKPCKEQCDHCKGYFQRQEARELAKNARECNGE